MKDGMDKNAATPALTACRCCPATVRGCRGWGPSGPTTRAPRRSSACCARRRPRAPPARVRPGCGPARRSSARHGPCHAGCGAPVQLRAPVRPHPPQRPAGWRDIRMLTCQRVPGSRRGRSALGAPRTCCPARAIRLFARNWLQRSGYLRLSVELKWFLIALSVRPGRHCGARRAVCSWHGDPKVAAVPAAAAGPHLGDLRPLVAQPRVAGQDAHVLLLRKRVLLHVRAQLVAPPAGPGARGVAGRRRREPTRRNGIASALA